ncbi:MAG: hypothetical protein H7Y07_04820 [Pyrinomonadaceae bacterium]|nr:hypothetical protein [Sphingobacteriaceae bacterium]
MDKAALKSGKYRVFWNTINQELGGCTLQSILWVKAPMDKKEFMLNKEDITNGLVQYSENCACCILLGLKPISGFLKGFNTTPEKKADETKWLIEGEIVLGTIANNRPVDTLKLKQYFYPNFVYD